MNVKISRMFDVDEFVDWLQAQRQDAHMFIRWCPMACFYAYRHGVDVTVLYNGLIIDNADKGHLQGAAKADVVRIVDALDTAGSGNHLNLTVSEVLRVVKEVRL